MSGRQTTQAPRGTAEAPGTEAVHRRQDPFAHGDHPQRPNYLPEEAEAAGSRSEIWATLKGLVVAAAVILFLGWLLTSG